MSMQTINLLMEVVLCNMGKNDAACPQMANINIMSISEATLHHHHHHHPSPCTRRGGENCIAFLRGSSCCETKSGTESLGSRLDQWC